MACALDLRRSVGENDTGIAAHDFDGQELSGEEIEDFDIYKYQEEYKQASSDEKERTFLGKFFAAAILQKCMVTNKIFSSGNKLAGFSKLINT